MAGRRREGKLEKCEARPLRTLKFAKFTARAGAAKAIQSLWARFQCINEFAPCRSDFNRTFKGAAQGLTQIAPAGLHDGEGAQRGGLGAQREDAEAARLNAVRGRTDAALARLDGLLTARPAGKLTWLGWLRNAPQSPAPGNVGKLLDRLGYADTVKRGSAKLGGDLKWDGPLTDIHFPTLTGQMTLEVEKGQFNKVDPGVGKLLGLLSLQSLPRRLTLDFGDIFSEGLAFDKIEGKMTVKAGVMRTAEPLRISSPAAQIDIKGETDLKNETQSLDVAVRPYVGGVAAAAGAATLVNPLLGAAALVPPRVVSSHPAPRPTTCMATIKKSGSFVAFHWDGAIADPHSSRACPRRGLSPRPSSTSR